MNSNINHKQQSPSIPTGAVSHDGAPAPQPKINEMIIPLLESSAYQRLTRILMVRPERVRQVEQYVIMLAQQGQVNQNHKLTDTELKGILDGLSRTETAKSAERAKTSGNNSASNGSNSTKNNGAFTQGITFNRRGGFMDDSDDDLDFVMPSGSSSTTTATAANNTNYNDANAGDDSDDDFFD
ncbi:hypothetical protein ACO0QE_000111 [Hanseniaspora vineae]